MIGVSVAVAVNELRPVRELLYVVLPEPVGVDLLRQQLVPKLLVRGKPPRIELRGEGVDDYRDTPSLTMGMLWNCITVFAMAWFATRIGLTTENLE